MIDKLVNISHLQIYFVTLCCIVAGAEGESSEILQWMLGGSLAIATLGALYASYEILTGKVYE